MARTGPPAYAWDWFTRQRLLWREARSRLAEAADTAAARRYAAVETRTDVVPMLRADYARDPQVREVVHAVVAEYAFLGRTDARFEDLGLRNPPRGLRWWWSALTGEEPDVAAGGVEPPAEPLQLELGEVLRGYGDG
ncbi:hypothetical protein [Egicoccus sp. AB-alg6-2]|uniref:hypothetical protein n=1 Tax=Egicoccus sp. AB-alg6-2 TaxID=3242692 RepID=UPI00359DC937